MTGLETQLTLLMPQHLPQQLMRGSRIQPMSPAYLPVTRLAMTVADRFKVDCSRISSATYFGP